MRRLLYSLMILMGAGLLTVSCSKENSVGNEGGTGTGGSLARFTIYDGYLYTVDDTVLKTYSLSDPETPELVSAVNIGWDIETIYPYQGNLFIGSMNAMYIFSLEDPAKPERKGMASHVRACDPVVAADGFAYVTVRSGTTCGGTTNALLVYDVQVLEKPRLLQTVNLQQPQGLAIQEDILYVCDGNAGLKLFDVSEPKSPAPLTTRDGYLFRDCIVYGDILFCMVDKGMVIYDITQPRNPVFVIEIVQ